MLSFLAKTFQGLEPVLAQELKDLGASNVELYNRAVSFEGDLALLYRANISLRTALRILHPLDGGLVRNQKELYELAHRINYLRWFTPEQTFAVFSTVQQAPSFPHTGFVALKVKDALVDQFRNLKGVRPSVDKDAPQIGIHVHLHGEQCTIFLDSTGESLHRRGYRRGGHPAPLNEVLAAGIVLLSGWDKEMTLVDGMCGSGTLLTEAALYARNQAPNLNRSSFGFQNWKNYEASLFEEAQAQAKAAVNEEASPKLIGFDHWPAALEEARTNAVNAEMDDLLRLSLADFFEKEAPPAPAMLLLNPPYGERLETEAEINVFYRRLGDRLKQAYKGYTAWVISANLPALKNLGLKPSAKHSLYNGNLPAQLAKYELY